MRLIDADKLKQHYSWWENEQQELFDSIVDAQPTVDAEPHWIPCSEMLPGDGVYLVYAPEYRGGSSRSKESHNGIMFAVFKNGKWSIEHCYYSRPNCVKAWMPLPKPYEVNHE
jgi:hypothetical protein